MNFAAEIAKLKQELADNATAHASLQASHKGLTEQLTAKDVQITQLTADLGKANADLDAANAKIADLKPKAEKTAEQIAAVVVQTVAAAGVEPVARIENPAEVTGGGNSALSPKQRLAAAFTAKLAA